MALRHHPYFTTLAITALVSNSLGIAIGARFIQPAVLEQTAVAAPLPSVESLPLQRSAENFRAVAKAVGPSVISIRASHEAPRQMRRSAPQGDPFSEFFGGRGFSFGFGNPNPGPSEAGGSGFVIDPNGTIVTNYHVVKGATKITVQLPDEDAEELPAKILGVDPRTDLAVLKITTDRPLSAVEWADFKDVEVGDSAIAIGSPFGLDHTVTAGIVSAKGRNASRLMGADFGYELIQTDTAINPGNSGGPLCTAQGKVMGVNTAIYSQSGGNVGIGFAIPSHVAKEVVTALIKNGKVTRGWLGVSIQAATADIKKEMGIASGVIVHEVQPDSPAEKAGLRAGDAITQVGDAKVAKVEELQRLISQKQPGDKLALKVVNYADGKSRTLDVKIGRLPDPKKDERDS